MNLANEDPHWNIRRANKPSLGQTLKQIIVENKPGVTMLLETRLKDVGVTTHLSQYFLLIVVVI